MFKGKTVVIIAAAGKGCRAGLPYNKLLARAGKKTILEHTVDKFSGYDIVIAASVEDIDAIKNIFVSNQNVRVVLGGISRTQSVRAALDYIKECDIVLIHDGARPNVSKELIGRVVEQTKEKSSAIPYIAATDTVKLLDLDGVRTIERDKVMFIQTPQGFDFNKIYAAYKNCGQVYTDDSQIFEVSFGKANYIEGEKTNYKITTPDDLERFEREFDINYRVGFGYDIHRLADGRKLVLGGVNIPYHKGLIGHSDADAAIHAAMDAMLSAAGLKDIGHYFPDSDQAYKDANSLELLKIVACAVKEQGFDIVNLSVTIIAESPKLAPYIDFMKRNIGTALNIPPDRIGISVTTNEKVGEIGNGDAIAVCANCLLKSF